MKHTFVSSTPSGQQTVTSITENPLQDISLSKKAIEFNQTPRTSRAKQLFNSLRSFTSTSATPTASPNRATTNGVVCRIPRACCRYSSPQKQPDFNKSPQMRLSQNVINATTLSMLDNRNDQKMRRRTESDGSSGNIARYILDIRSQANCDQLSNTSATSSVVDSIQSPDLRRNQPSNQMSSIPKSLTETKRSTPLVNGGIPNAAMASRIPAAPGSSGAMSATVATAAAASQGRKTRMAAVAPVATAPPQKTLLTGRLNVTSPPIQRTPEAQQQQQQSQPQQYASVRRAELAKVIGQATTTSNAAAQGHQGNPTYALIAYQPTQSDPHRKNSNQPAVLYAIPSNHAFLQPHQIQQLIQQQQQQQHSAQTASGVVAPTAVLVSTTRSCVLPHTHVHGVGGSEAIHQHQQGQPQQGQQQPQRIAIATTTSTSQGGIVGHRPGELVCTCPPELHQALIEQHQQRPNQQQQHTSQNFVQINRDQPTVVQLPDGSNAALQAEGKASMLDGGQSQSADQHHTPRGTQSTQESDAESHVNYLITLFQVLKSSGVREESFVNAFRLMGLTPQISGTQRAAAVRAKNELHHVRVALSDLKQEHMQMRAEFGKEIQICEKQIAMQLKKYERRKGLQQAHPFYDSRIHKVRSDRQTLDKALAAYQTTWSSLIGQLADLEGVIEETGNDVLKGRCRITLQMVSALEDRLQLATSAIEFCCENDPLLRKSVWQHAENEMDSAEQETRILEEQLEQLSDLRERSARLNGTIITLKRLAKVNANARQNEQQVQRLRSIGGVLNPTAADNGSAERKRLMATIRLLQPDHDERMRSIEIQEALRERRKRVFRDPPVFKGPAKALLLNGIHIAPIWPEGFSRRSHRNTTPTPEPPDTPTVSEEPPEISNTTANLPQPLRLPVSTVLVSRLKNPNTPKVKQNVRVKFNTQVYVEGEDRPLPLNCILEEDTNGSNKRKSAPALPSPEETIPPAPPPRLTSQPNSISSLSNSNDFKNSQVKMLRYENMDMFLKNFQQISSREKNVSPSAQN